tara:strand:- start:889823 stop:891079 length:1257 start_codon:yes stop_codon:yes gene_type:complete
LSDPQSFARQPDPPLDLAIVAWQALPAAIPKAGRNVGGLETAAWLLARGFARRKSTRCSLFVRADKAVQNQRVDQVDLVIDVDPRESVRRDVSGVFESGMAGAIKKVHPRLLWQIPYLALTRFRRRPDPPPRQPDPRLSSHQPDIWIAMGVSGESARVVATAKRQQRPSILMIQSNADLDARYASNPAFKSRYGERSDDCLFAIQHADRIVCQTQDQMRLLQQNFDREGVLVRNAIDLDRWSSSATQQGDHVLWIGRYDDFHKRPQLAMDIAEKCPEIPFHMIINRSDPEIERRLRQDCPPNVTIGDYVGNDDMPKAMGECRLFLSTGSAAYEGFPNVLLQATAAGKPIVSLDDFDGYLARSGAGFHTGHDLDAAAAVIGELFSGQRVYDRDHAIAFLRENHAVDAIIDQLFRLLADL